MFLGNEDKMADNDKQRFLGKESSTKGGDEVKL